MKLHQHFDFGPALQDPFSFCQIQLALDTVYVHCTVIRILKKKHQMLSQDLHFFLLSFFFFFSFFLSVSFFLFSFSLFLYWLIFYYFSFFFLSFFSFSVSRKSKIIFVWQAACLSLLRSLVLLITVFCHFPYKPWLYSRLILYFVCRTSNKFENRKVLYSA